MCRGCGAGAARSRLRLAKVSYGEREVKTEGPMMLAMLAAFPLQAFDDAFLFVLFELSTFLCVHVTVTCH